MVYHFSCKKVEGMSVSDLRREPDLRNIASAHAPTYWRWVVSALRLNELCACVKTLDRERDL